MRTEEEIKDLLEALYQRLHEDNDEATKDQLTSMWITLRWVMGEEI